MSTLRSPVIFIQKMRHLTKLFPVQLRLHAGVVNVFLDIRRKISKDPILTVECNSKVAKAQSYFL